MITLAQAQAKLAEYQAAETLILEAQEVRLGGAGIDRSQRMTDLLPVQKGIATWQRIVDNLSAAAAGQPTYAGLTFSSARFN